MTERNNKMLYRLEELSRADDVGEGGVVGLWFDLGVGFAKNSVRVAGALATDTVREVGERYSDTLSCVEGFPKSGFQLARMAFDAVDVLTRDGIARLERGAMGTVSALERGAEEVSKEAGRAAARVVGRAAAEPVASTPA